MTLTDKQLRKLHRLAVRAFWIGHSGRRVRVGPVSIIGHGPIHQRWAPIGHETIDCGGGVMVVVMPETWQDTWVDTEQAARQLGMDARQLGLVKFWQLEDPMSTMCHCVNAGVVRVVIQYNIFADRMVGRLDVLGA